MPHVFWVTIASTQVLTAGQEAVCVWMDSLTGVENVVSTPECLIQALNVPH